MATLRYADLLKEVNDAGCSCPPDGSAAVTSNIVYRYIFENDTKKKNHLPSKMISPNRKLKDDSEKCSVCGLSCYYSESLAIEFFNNLIKTVPNIYNNIGESLAKGAVANTDGLATVVDMIGHFDFFEYDHFDPHTCFTFVKRLI